MNRSICKRLGAAAVCIVLALALAAPAAAAPGGVETGRAASLSISSPACPTAFSLYRVGDVSETGALSLCGAFAAYPVELTADPSGWRALAQTLETYVLRDGAAPITARETPDADGMYRFTGLTAGVFLLLGRRCTADGVTRTPQPMLLVLPYRVRAEDPWQYDVTAAAKYTEEPDGSGGDGETVTRRVVKLWDDAGHETERPAEITVELLCDGRLWESVRLGRESHWRHTWSGLPAGHTWHVAEREVPEGYTVRTEREDGTFLITNRLREVPPGPEPDLPGVPPEPEGPGGPEMPRLPQTGVLWWPVPLLALAGTALCVFGRLQQRREDGDEP